MIAVVKNKYTNMNSFTFKIIFPPSFTCIVLADFFFNLPIIFLGTVFIMIYIWNSIYNEVIKSTIGCINRERTTNKNTAATTIYTMAAVIIGCCFNNHPQIQITGYSHALYKDNQMYPVICFDIYRCLT